MNGMEMMLKSLGLDPKALEKKAFDSLKELSDTLRRIEDKQDKILAYLEESDQLQEELVRTNGRRG
jgi:hypothetical protein